MIEINLSELEPHIVGPYSPDLSRKVSDMPLAIKKNNYDDDLKVGLIGSCTNSSYEDIEKAAHVAKQALDRGLKLSQNFISLQDLIKLRLPWNAMAIQKFFIN